MDPEASQSIREDVRMLLPTTFANAQIDFSTFPTGLFYKIHSSKYI